ncbi:MAG: hypothetical protein ACTSRU_11905 [Candidatus Hodarchaeales archaeon]
MISMTRKKTRNTSTGDIVREGVVQSRKRLARNDCSGSPLSDEHLQRLLSLHAKSSKLIWEQQNHLKVTIDEQELDLSYRALFNDELLFIKIINSEDTLWKQAFILGKLYMTREMVQWEKSLLDLFLDFKFLDDEGQSFSGMDIKIGMLNPSRAVRKRFFELKQLRGRELIDIFNKSYPSIDTKAVEQGFNGYLECRCLDNGISESQLKELLDKVEKMPFPLETGIAPVDLAFYIRIYDQMTAKALPDISTSEVLDLIRESIPECFRDEFSRIKYYTRVQKQKSTRTRKQTILTAIESVFFRLKKELPAIKINEITSQNNVETAFCMPFKIPDDIRIRLSDSKQDFSNYKTIFHETGHGLHFTSMVNTGNGNIYTITEPHCFMEAMAKFFELFFFDSFVKTYNSEATITGFKIASLIRLKHYASLVKIILLLVEKFKVSNSMTTAIAEVTSLYPGIYSAYMNTEKSIVPPECWVGFLGAVQDPFYYIEYMLSYFIAYRLYASYESRKGTKKLEWFKYMKYNLFYPANHISWT